MIHAKSYNSTKAKNIDELPVKISFVGFPAVGKTTILKLLSENIVNQFYIPTMGFDFRSVKIGNKLITVWDFGGQKSFLDMNLSHYLFGSDIIFIVTDSTPKNVLDSRKLLDISRDNIEDDGVVFVLANKQDLPGHMDAERVESVLHCKTYPCTAIDPAERSNLMKFIERELDIASNIRRKK